MIHIGIKALPHGFIEDFPKIGAAVAEERSDSFQLDIAAEVMINIIKDIIQHRIAGRISCGIHDHFRLF